LTWTEARKFAVEMFVVLTAVALWLWLRKHHPAAAAAVGGGGAAILAGGFVAPRAVLALKSVWMGFAHVVGRVNGTLLLVVIFFVVLTPVAAIRRLFRKSPVGWEAHEKRAPDHFEHPY
jgi:hypothetical protein